MHFLDSLDDHGFSEEEMRLTIEYGMNCHVRSLLDSLCDGDLFSKSDDEAYDLFYWLNRESRKPNFSLLLSIEENTIVNVDEAFGPLNDDVEDNEGVIEVDNLLDDSCTPVDVNVIVTSDDNVVCEPSTLDMDVIEKFGVCKVKPLSDISPFDDDFSRGEECMDFDETLLVPCDLNSFDNRPIWDEHIDDSWEAQVDAIEAALNGSGNIYLEFCEFDLSESELVEIEAAFMDEMVKSEKENHGDDTLKNVDLAFSSPLFYSPPYLQSPLTHTYDSFEGLDLHFSPTSPTHFEKKDDVLSDFRSVDLALVNLKANYNMSNQKKMLIGLMKVRHIYEFQPITVCVDWSLEEEAGDDYEKHDGVYDVEINYSCQRLCVTTSGSTWLFSSGTCALKEKVVKLHCIEKGMALVV
ncbi:hypothetical protein KSS87_023710 [Heliosperma pusillum]|nr:hypothetical protein KSS87_023710 [Heliosperma pusillum]